MRALYLVCLLVLCGCQSELQDCISQSPQGTLVIEALDYDSLVFEDNMHLLLHDSPANRMVIQAEESILSRISIKRHNNILKVQNGLACQWMAPDRMPVVNIYIDDIKNIRLQGIVDLRSPDTLRYDGMILEVRGTGDIELLAAMGSLGVINQYSSIITVRGRANSMWIASLGAGIFRGQHFVVRSASIDHQGSNDIHVYPCHRLSGRIWNSGHVLYYRRPQVIEMEYVGSGTAIDMSE